jgi:hypothetical protein
MIKYLYFEIHWQDGEMPTNPEIRNENILLLKPHTNSSGEWGFTNVTKSKYYTTTVDQSWIDLEKYTAQKTKWDDPVYSKYDKWVQEALKKVELKLKEAEEVKNET